MKILKKTLAENESAYFRSSKMMQPKIKIMKTLPVVVLKRLDVHHAWIIVIAPFVEIGLEKEQQDHSGQENPGPWIPWEEKGPKLDNLKTKVTHLKTS